MKSFKLYSLQEAQTKAAMEMEMLIVSAAGGPKYVPKDKKISKDAGKKIIKDLKLRGKGAMPKNAYESNIRLGFIFSKLVEYQVVLRLPKQIFL